MQAGFSGRALLVAPSKLNVRKLTYRSSSNVTLSPKPSDSICELPFLSAKQKHMEQRL